MCFGYQIDCFRQLIDRYWSKFVEITACKGRILANVLYVAPSYKPYMISENSSKTLDETKRQFEIHLSGNQQSETTAQ